MKRETKNLFSEYALLMLRYDITRDENILLILEEYQNKMIKLIEYKTL